MKIETLHDLYARELQDIYGSEKLLVKWLSKMADAADLTELRRALTDYTMEARAQLTRIERIFPIHGEKPLARDAKIVDAIIHEAEEDMAVTVSAMMRDAVIVAAVQMAKHYEIAAYGSLQTYATYLGHTDDAKMLQATLQEERAADRKLAEIALNYMKVESRV
jgi:ferritin-like metal-binding protein YciE